jgi:hypothetical protein
MTDLGKPGETLEEVYREAIMFFDSGYLGAKIYQEFLGDGHEWRLWPTVYHESAHAFLTIHIGWPLDHILISADGTGHCASAADADSVGGDQDGISKVTSIYRGSRNAVEVDPASIAAECEQILRQNWDKVSKIARSIYAHCLGNNGNEWEVRVSGSEIRAVLMTPEELAAIYET